MMREIKFRAWDKKQAKMINELNPSHLDSNDLVVMQYTGLKDKNGTDIYGGDKRPDGCFVGWNQLHCCFGWFSEHGYAEDMQASVYDEFGFLNQEWKIDEEIIGNIYEHQKDIP